MQQASTLKGMSTIAFMRVSFGRNRRRTREKTQASKEKAAKKDPEKERSPVTLIDRHRGKNPEVKIH